MGFLGKARKMIGRGGSTEPPKPQYYQVACPEGHIIRGERTEGYQALRCPHCGDGVFVLPRSPLPLPPTPSTARAKVRPSASYQPESYQDVGIELTEAPPQEELEEIQWIDPAATEPGPAPRRAAPPDPEPPSEVDFSPEVAAEFEPKAEPAAPPKAKPRPASQPRPKAATAAPSAQRDRPARASGMAVEVEPGRIAVAPRRRRGSQVALVVSAVAILAIGSYFYKSYKNRLAELPHEAEVNAAEGKAALETGRFDEAKVKLGRAAKAYRQLKASDEAAVEAIQLAEEAAILADQSSREPKEIVEDIARRDDADGTDRFEREYKNRAVLLSAKIKKVGDPIELDYLILVGRGPTPAKTGRFDLTGFKLLEGRNLKKDDQIIFGARYDSIRIEGGEWRITLQPDSGTWMTNAKALAIALPELQQP